ncbi:hypothetical protein HYG86_11405 [Alkalicella caledoniensis]|uniref:Uncharacterized protein n=1 Tax=Alkalicella caledoniensis TaxID=2731377 RepID=A0A7G9W9G7_ALKCA|nr:hypothetical protein [Alkalicella caledoniensis]QNO15329.1 hypothetical protein HYG86_11405 [Alkalicella caledoniensis]
MNQNIEVINPKLWAVRFNLIPFIKEIDYKPDAATPAYEEPARITNDGKLLLNKDCPIYQLMKDMFPKIMKKKDEQLQKELKNSQIKMNKTDMEILYASMLQVEIERRAKERGES